MINTIIFDCDGVILDSEILIQKTLMSSIMRYVNNNEIHLSPYDFLGLGFDKLKDKMKDISDVGITQEMINKYYVDLFQAMKHQLNSLLRDLILTLNQQRITYCVASNSIREQINYSLSLVHLKKYIPDNHIFTIEQVAHGKPAPDLFLFSAAAMGVKPEYCLVVEDTPEGIEAALSANMNAIAFLGGTHAQSETYQSQFKSYPIQIASTEQELISILKSNYGFSITK
ncbi:HAD family hydrolase [Legionella rowbothamii]|uniref:HAD family hydrolase n=1 Tax=Legionella rowbothamii TaxID=96229 RepID=UPI0013EF607A|nr:HAD-IA family hydrolase [Legionella rowbothamii]